jgi:hypothetical protein
MVASCQLPVASCQLPVARVGALIFLMVLLLHRMGAGVNGEYLAAARERTKIRASANQRTISNEQ